MKRLIAITILILTVFPSFMGGPSTANAVGTGQFIPFTSCVTGAYFGQQLGQLIAGLPGLGSAINSIDKVPVLDQTHINTYLQKETLKDIAARCGARSVLNLMLEGIYEGYREKGRDGGSALVQNWRNYITNSQYRGEEVFRAILANTQVCKYLERDMYGLFRTTAQSKVSLSGQNIRVNDLDPFTLRARCTLPSTFDVTKFRKDFAGNGGWQTLLALTEPQNNPYGLFLMSQGELERQRDLAQQADANEVIDGYTSIRGEGGGANSCLLRGSNGRCIFYKEIHTSGASVRDALAAAVNAELDWVTDTDELSELIATATTVLLNRIFDSTNPEDGEYTMDTDPIFQVDCVRMPTASISPGASPRPQDKLAIQRELDNNRGNLLDTANGSILFPAQKEINKQRMRGKISEFDSTFLRATASDAEVTARQAALTRLREEIMDLVEGSKKGTAASLLGVRESLLQQLRTLLGVSDTSNCPPDPTPPPAPTVTPGPSGPPNTCGGPNSDGCTVNFIGKTCVQSQFRNDVLGAINATIDAGTGMEAPGSRIIIDYDAYYGSVRSILESKGYTVFPDPGEEMGIKRSNDFEENWDIATGKFEVREFHASTCRPPNF